MLSNFIKIMIGAILFVMLTGASCMKKEPTQPMFRVDSSLMVPCPKPSRVPITSEEGTPLGEIILSDIDLAGEYRICATRMDGWIESYKQYRKEIETNK